MTLLSRTRTHFFFFFSNNDKICKIICMQKAHIMVERPYIADGSGMSLSEDWESMNSKITGVIISPLEVEQGDTKHRGQGRHSCSLKSFWFFLLVFFKLKIASHKPNNSSQWDLGLIPLYQGILFIILIIHHSKVIRYYCKNRSKLIGIDFSNEHSSGMYSILKKVI